MKQDDKDFMELNRPHYTTLVMAGFVQNLTYDIKERWLNIIRENYATNYLCCLHCGGLIAALLLPTSGVTAKVPLFVMSAYLLVAVVVLRSSKFKATY